MGKILAFYPTLLSPRNKTKKKRKLPVMAVSVLFNARNNNKDNKKLSGVELVMKETKITWVLNVSQGLGRWLLQHYHVYEMMMRRIRDLVLQFI